MFVREENSSDYNEVFKVVENAFKNAEHTNHKEQFLLEKLRESDEFIPQLSLVCVLNNKIIGHVMLTKAFINKDFKSLIVAPLSVLPEYQRKGVGTLLMKEAHKRALELGYTNVVLVGHPSYYPRFGYKKLSTWGIKMPFDIEDDDVCMGVELVPNALKNISGTLSFSPALCP